MAGFQLSINGRFWVSTEEDDHDAVHLVLAIIYAVLLPW
jgi:hypothetical protein